MFSAKISSVFRLIFLRPESPIEKCEINATGRQKEQKRDISVHSHMLRNIIVHGNICSPSKRTCASKLRRHNLNQSLKGAVTSVFFHATTLKLTKPNFNLSTLEKLIYDTQLMNGSANYFIEYESKAVTFEELTAELIKNMLTRSTNSCVSKTSRIKKIG